MTERLLNSFPPKHIKKAIFVSGGAFRKKHEFENEGEKKRFFFILNKSPEKDDRLVTVHTTTKIRKRKKHRRAEVLVEITTNEYSSLKKRSVIDCDSYHIWRKSIIEDQINKHKIEPLPPLPSLILERLRNAISFSKTLAPIDKRLVLGRCYYFNTGIDAVVSGKDGCRGTEATAADLGPLSNGGTIIFHPGSGRSMVDTDGNLG